MECDHHIKSLIWRNAWNFEMDFDFLNWLTDWRSCVCASTRINTRANELNELFVHDFMRGRMCDHHNMKRKCFINAGNSFYDMLDLCRRHSIGTLNMRVDICMFEASKCENYMYVCYFLLRRLIGKWMHLKSGAHSQRLETMSISRRSLITALNVYTRQTIKYAL